MKNVTILVHGFADSSKRMAYMAKFLSNRGWRILTPTLAPSNGSVPLEELSDQLAIFINKNTAENERINLVGYSMGGLICRYYLQRLGGLARTDKFVSVSTPHHGTITAYLFKTPGVHQMRPKSAFLQDLQKDEDQLKRISCTVFYTALDLTIVPAGSSIVSFANVVKFFVPIHFLMVYYLPLCIKLNQILLEPLEKVNS